MRANQRSLAQLVDASTELAACGSAGAALLLQTVAKVGALRESKRALRAEERRAEQQGQQRLGRRPAAVTVPTPTVAVPARFRRVPHQVFADEAEKQPAPAVLTVYRNGVFVEVPVPAHRPAVQPQYRNPVPAQKLVPVQKAAAPVKRQNQ